MHIFNQYLNKISLKANMARFYPKVGLEISVGLVVAHTSALNIINALGRSKLKVN